MNPSSDRLECDIGGMGEYDLFQKVLTQAEQGQDRRERQQTAVPSLGSKNWKSIK